MAWIRDYTVFEQLSASANPAPDVVYPVHQAGDVILLMLAVDGTNIPALPSGYTDIQNQAGASQAFRLCYKIAASSNEVCPTLSVSVAEEWHIIVIAVAGANTSTPINVSGKRAATDAAAPFTWTSGLSTTENNVLIFQYCNSDMGLALTAQPPYTNLVNGDAGQAGVGCAYTFQPTAGAITDCEWTGRANDDTTACLVGIADDGNGRRPGYADPQTSGKLVSALGGTSLIEGDTNPAALTFGGVGQRDISQCWSFDGSATYTNETTDINSPAAGDVTIPNAVGACWFFGFEYTFAQMLLQVSTAQSGGVVVWEYWNGSAWTSLAGFTGVLTATGWVRLYWTLPTDWAQVNVNGVTRYYVRMRVTTAFTTAPILSRGHIGGWPTTYDAIGNAADAGVNPYNDAISLTPAATMNPSGSERQFGAAKNFSTGILILHHKSQLPRDYVVDPTINDVTYPIANGSILRSRGGFLIVLADAASSYEAYSIHGKGSLSNHPISYNVAAIGLNNNAQAWGRIGTLNKAAVTRMLFLPQGDNQAMLAYVSGLAWVSEIVIAGGDSVKPIDLSQLKWIVNNCIGTTLLFNGEGVYNKVYAPMRIGGNHRVNIAVDGAYFAMPTKYDGKRYFDWNADDNVAGWVFYGTGSSDSIKFTNCSFVGMQPFRWEFHSSHSPSTTLDFSGTLVQGATVTLRSTVTLNDVKFISCPTFTLNGADLIGCTFINTTVQAASPADAAGISGCSFTSGGSGHAIEIGGTAADFTLSGCRFTGYSGTGTNAAIYVNISSGSMIINITDGGDTPSVRTAGANVTVVNAVTVKVTVKDVNTGSPIGNARVIVEADAGGPLQEGTDILTGLTDAFGVVQTTTNYQGTQPVIGKVRRASSEYGTLYKSSPLSGTITSAGLDITVLLIRDE